MAWELAGTRFPSGLAADGKPRPPVFVPELRTSLPAVFHKTDWHLFAAAAMYW